MDGAPGVHHEVACSGDSYAWTCIACALGRLLTWSGVPSPRGCRCTAADPTHFISASVFQGGRQWRGAHRTCGSAVTLCVLSFKSCSDPRGCQRAVTAATPSVQRCSFNFHGAQHE